MIIATWAALGASLVAGFTIGREWDRGIKRVRHNRRLRIQEAEREKARLAHQMESARIQRELEAEQHKKMFVNSIYQNADCIKGSC